MTYLALGSLLVLVAVVVRAIAEVVARRRGHRIPLLPTALAAAALVALTAVFDTAMIAAGLFAYADAHVSGLRIGLAPVEDFSYPIALAIALPGLWELAGERRADAES
ncbi:lycopene cyclase domain-containing protein [Microbacterium sp.]|uniref:lycopene cyclase domain-containing protein n=1 Tax=Microbacterium sp. TaxID=51671 RepID=UPI0032215552